MGASAEPYWRGIDEGQRRSLPGFYNDCKHWADWLVRVVGSADEVSTLSTLGCDALLSFKTEGIEDAEVAWVSPGDLYQAAHTVGQLLAARDPAVDGLVVLYPNGEVDPDGARARLRVDLADISKMAARAAELHVARMTIEVNW